MACQIKSVPPVQHNKWPLRAPNGLMRTHAAAIIPHKKTGCVTLLHERPIEIQLALRFNTKKKDSGLHIPASVYLFN